MSKCPFAQSFSKKDITDRATVATNVNGKPLDSNQTSMTVGPRGPVVMNDPYLFDKLGHQNRERIPERVVHAKGWGLHGVFKVTKDITKWSKAKVFSEVGKETEMLVRWSNVAGERGAADVERDLRGFALKFYTEEGNWDLVANNTPIFFVRDPILFPDFIRSQKRNPMTNIRSPEAMFDFWSRHPESIHQVLWLFGDRGLPKSPMHMNGYGSHTFSLINDKNERVWCKFHMHTHQGHVPLTNEEAEKIIGSTRESFQVQLLNAVSEGKYPKWTMFVQIMTQEEAKSFRWNPFDLTKIWPQKDFPLHEVGEMTFNKVPSNYHVFVEQASFAPSNLVPGISISPDKMLQARLFAYSDAHRYRLGTNFFALPPNLPKRCPFGFYSIDGAHRDFANDNGEPDAYYDDSSYGGPKVSAAVVEEPPMEIEDGAQIRRYPQEITDEDFEQPRMLWEKVFDEDQRKRACFNFAAGMGPCSDAVKKRFFDVLRRVSKDCGDRVEEAVKTIDTDVNSIAVTSDSRITSRDIPADKVGPRVGHAGSTLLVADGRAPPPADQIACPDLGKSDGPKTFASHARRAS